MIILLFLLYKCFVAVNAKREKKELFSFRNTFLEQIPSGNFSQPERIGTLLVDSLRQIKETLGQFLT